MIDIKAIRAQAEACLEALHTADTPSEWIMHMHPATVLELCREIERVNAANDNLYRQGQKMYASLQEYERRELTNVPPIGTYANTSATDALAVGPEAMAKLDDLLDASLKDHP